MEILLQSVQEYIATIVEKLILQPKCKSTDCGKIGLSSYFEHIPVMIGLDAGTIINFVNQNAYGRYVSEDFEHANKNELIAHTKTC